MQVMAEKDINIPPYSGMNLMCKIRCTPWMNLPHEVRPAMLSAAGVWTGRAWVSITSDESFPVPALNTTDHPFKIKEKHLITFAEPMVPGDLPDFPSDGDSPSLQARSSRGHGPRSSNLCYGATESDNGRYIFSACRCFVDPDCSIHGFGKPFLNYCDCHFEYDCPSHSKYRNRSRSPGQPQDTDDIWSEASVDEQF